MIFLLSGAPGAGKSSVARALAMRFPFGLHLPVDDLREFVVSGIAHPIPIWTEETTRQFRLARQSAASMAQRYATEGFVVVVDDVLFPAEAVELFEAPLAPFAIHKVLLHPSLEAVLARNIERSHKPFDTARLAEPIYRIHQAIAEQPYREAGWRVLDSSDMTVAETTSAILRPLGLAAPEGELR